MMLYYTRKQISLPDGRTIAAEKVVNKRDIPEDMFDELMESGVITEAKGVTQADVDADPRQNVDPRHPMRKTKTGPIPPPDRDLPRESGAETVVQDSETGEELVHEHEPMAGTGEVEEAEDTEDNGDEESIDEDPDNTEDSDAESKPKKKKKASRR